jgi:hypothetical protein
VKRTFVPITTVIALVVAWILAPSVADAAELEWRTKKQLTLEQAPLDVATTSDGKMIFILTPGEILVYSPSEDEVTNNIPVGESFDRLTYSSTDNSLILGSSSDKALEIIRIDAVYDIAISGRPFRGPEDAPVTIAVFSDFQ